jgi:hypothetical protein
MFTGRLVSRERGQNHTVLQRRRTDFDWLEQL